MEDSENNGFCVTVSHTLKISTKNLALMGKYNAKPLEKFSFDSEKIDELIQQEIENSRNRRTPQFFSEVSLEGISPIDPFFFISPDLLKDSLPVLIRTPSFPPSASPDAKLFELGKLCAYQGLIPRALKNIKEAFLISGNPLYSLWEALLLLKNPKNIEEVSEQCCSGRKVPSSKSALLLNLLKTLPKSIESLWLLMQFSYEHPNEIEHWQYYGGEILILDKYYGYLLWGTLSLRSQNTQTLGISILTEITEKFPKHPDAYILLWEYFYYKKKYIKAYDTIAEGFLKVVDEKYPRQYILNVILYSKSLCKIQRFTTALELLQEKFIKDPGYIQFLYRFGKICIMSGQGKMHGAGLGALREVKRTVKNDGKLFYLLGKACFDSGRIFEAKKYFLRAGIFLAPNCKIEQKTRKKIEKIEKSIIAIEEVQGKLASDLAEEVKELFFLSNPYAYAELKLIHAQILVDSNNSEGTLEILQKLNNLKAFSFLQRHICKGLPYEKANSILYSALKNLKTCTIPTYELVKSCKIYCKFLISHKKTEKALLILKSLLKLNPVWQLEVPYCSQIQKADNIFDLIRNESRNNSFCNDYCLAREFIFQCIDPKASFNDDGSSFLFTKREVHTRISSLETFANSSLDENEYFLGKNLSPQQQKKLIACFSIYTKPDILFTIGKIAAAHAKFKKEAEKALTDFITLSHNSRKRQKAEFLLTCLQ